jgi:CelD/BcsL family acetyltransferase involved in cellulose biosynthesis
MAPFEIDLEPVGDHDNLAALWLDLEGRGEPSFFLSWFWVGSWLRALPEGLDARLLTVRRDGMVVGLGVFVFGPHGLSPLGNRRAHLHETGDPVLDVATIEDNGLLVDRRFAGEVEAAALLWLTDGERKIDRVALGGVTPVLAGVTEAIASQRRLLCDVRNDSPRPYVDLDHIRRNGCNYLACLSANTRQTIRRSMRLYERRGPIEFRTATTIGEAEDFLSRLEALHQVYWTSRGKPGAFSFPTFRRLHGNLVRQAFPAGAVRLCSVAAGGIEIGYLYNFAWRGRVYAYQSGFRYDADNRHKPGLVSHCLAIEEAVSRGDSVYDFMAGSRQHKTSLSTHQDRLYWVVLRRPTTVTRIRRQLNRIRGRAGASFPKPGGPPDVAAGAR